MEDKIDNSIREEGNENDYEKGIVDGYYEPLYDPANYKYSAHPINPEFEDIWEHYHKMQNVSWFANEIDFSDIGKDFKKLTLKEQHFIKYIIAFFAQSDGLVNENLSINFANEFTPYEVLAAYRFQEAMEDVHNETYSLLIEHLPISRKEKNEMFDAVKENPSIKKKTEWAQKWENRNVKPAARIFAFAIVEGVFFSGAFCSIYWIKEKGILKALTQANEFISRDEGLHTDCAALIYDKIRNKLTQEEAETILTEAVDHEIDFISDALPYNLEEMNSKLMSRYIKYVADRLMKQLGFNPIYKCSNPFPFMEHISVDEKTNFFEGRNTSYARGNIKEDDFNDWGFIDKICKTIESNNINEIEY